VQPGYADDATRVPPNHPDGADDRTRPMPRSNEPTRSDGTRIMPAVGAEPGWGADNAQWSGRAEVRPPRAEQYSTTTTEWATEPPAEPRGKWWMPILIGIVALLLLALLGWGIYLIAQHQGDDSAPAPTPSAAPTATATTAPTTEPPTTGAPTTTAPTPEQVTVPALRGLSQEAAQQALSRRGLSARLKYRNSSQAPAGTVIDSDPAEGQEVPPDSVVTLIIASAQPSPSASPSSSSPTAQADQD
jgi:PASTA domain-containing protein